MTNPEDGHIEGGAHEILKIAIQEKRWEDAYKIQKTLKEEDHVLTEGPLPKSIYTIQLEALVRELMKPEGERYKLVKLNDIDFIVFENGEQYNWTDIRENADFQQIELRDSDFMLYENYMKSIQDNYILPKATVVRDRTKDYQRKLYKDYKSLPDIMISVAEMQAINIYSKDFYSTMNAALRAALPLGKNAITRHAIIQSVLCCSGLGKIPQTPIQHVYRGAKWAQMKSKLPESWRPQQKTLFN